MFQHSHKMRKLIVKPEEHHRCAIANCQAKPEYLARVQKVVAPGTSFPRLYKLCAEHAKLFADKHSLEVA